MPNIKLSNLQLNKLKSGIKGDTEVTLKISSNVVGDSNDENNFPHKLLLTNNTSFLLLYLLINLLADKEATVTSQCRSTIRAGEGTIRNNPLTNFKIQKYYQGEPKFKGVYSRNDSRKIKYGAYVINLDKYESIETHWIALCVNDNNLTYFNSFGAEHI